MESTLRLTQYLEGLPRPQCDIQRHARSRWDLGFSAAATSRLQRTTATHPYSHIPPCQFFISGSPSEQYAIQAWQAHRRRNWGLQVDRSMGEVPQSPASRIRQARRVQREWYQSDKLRPLVKASSRGEAAVTLQYSHVGKTLKTF